MLKESKCTICIHPSREGMEALSLEVFKQRVDVALKGMVSGHGGEGLGLDYTSLVVFSTLNDSVILYFLGKREEKPEFYMWPSLLMEMAKKSV